MNGPQNARELAQLEAGLAQSRDLRELIRDLQPQSAHQLYSKALHYVKWTGFMMAVAGIYFLALKEKVGHGNFKAYLAEKRFQYMFAWECMKAAHVVSRHPLFGELRASRAFRSLVMLPEPEQDALARELKDIPADRLDDLMPNLIQKRYNEIRDEEKASRKKPRTPEQEAALREQAARVKKEMEEEDPDWREVRRLWVEAVGSLNALADKVESIDLKKEHYDEVFDKARHETLCRPMERILRKWRPVEEVLKRGEVMERPSFASPRATSHEPRAR